ncbi:MAG: MFS transporter [Bacteroidetes bacterium]|nr:MFS transporter [Bacteroidota bacterium]
MNKLTRKEISLLLTLALVQFTHILDAMILMPLAPNLKKTICSDSRHFGFLVASYGFSAFVSAICSTFWADKFDRKKVMVFLYTGFLIGTGACACAQTYSFFIGARIFTGFFGGVAGAIILSIVGDVIPLERRARGMGILMAGFSLASIVGVPMGIVLAENFNWHVAFYMICGIGVPVYLMIIFTIPSITIHLQNKNEQKKNLYRVVFSNRNQVRALLFSLSVVIAHFGIIPYISDYLVNNMKFDLKTQVVFMYVIGGMLTVVAAPLIGKLADRHGRYKVLIVLNAFAIIPIFLISHFNSHSFWAMIGTASMFFIFSGGRMVPSSTMVTSAIEPEHRGGFMGLNSAVQQLGVASTTIIGGLIIKNDHGILYNYGTVGWITIGFTFLVFLTGYGLKAVK